MNKNTKITETNIEVYTVHVICWDNIEYNREATKAEIDMYRKDGYVKGDGYSEVIFDFRQKNTNKTIVYEFLYNSDCHESTASTISIHKTRKGAEMAMEFHKNEKRNDWKKEYEDYSKDFPFDYDQWWGIRESELLD